MFIPFKITKITNHNFSLWLILKAFRDIILMLRLKIKTLEIFIEINTRIDYHNSVITNTTIIYKFI